MGVEQAAKSIKNKIEKTFGVNTNNDNNTSNNNDPNLNKKETIPEPIECPFCKKVYDCKTTYNDFNLHIKKCVKLNKSCELYPTSQDITLNSIILKNINNYQIIYNNQNKNLENFEKKVEKLKTVIQSVKISWQDGFCQLDLDRQNFLGESMEQIDTVDLHKELKINFIDFAAWSMPIFFISFFINTFLNY